MPDINLTGEDVDYIRNLFEEHRDWMQEQITRCITRIDDAIRNLPCDANMKVLNEDHVRLMEHLEGHKEIRQIRLSKKNIAIGILGLLAVLGRYIIDIINLVRK